MLAEELIKLVETIQKNKSESQIIEVKSANKGCPKRLYDTLSSFSNQDSGGVIVFGLDEEKNFEALGVYDLQDLQKKVTEQCNQMEPPVRGIFTQTEYLGVNICSIEIPSIEITKRPCFYKGKGKETSSYVRFGDADLIMTSYEIYSFEAFKERVYNDERKVIKVKDRDMELEQIERYVSLKKYEKPKFSRLDKKQIYELLNIKKDGNYTLASVMNFSIYPQGIFPQFGVTAIVVPGYKIGEVGDNKERFLDNKRIEGTIAEMLEESLSFCRRNMKVKTIIDSTTGMRRDETEYPINAIREAILNALIHRDYSVHTEGTPIQIDFFADRLEIHSPGGLYGRMTVEQLGKSRPDLRNPTLAIMAETLNKTENRYSGIPTIRLEMKEHGLREPIFKDERNEFVVILYNDKIIYENEEEVFERKILEFCREPKSRKEIAEFIGIKTVTYAYTKYIEPLIKNKKLGMTIPNTPTSKNQKYFKV